MKITKQRLKEIIKEELGEAREESLNPEWDEADKILSALVTLADNLVLSTKAPSRSPALAIVSKLREAVDAMERRLNEKFAAAAEDEVSDEEALVLKGPQFDPLGDSLPARRQRASVRRGDK
jgi:hypothetical protein